MDSFYIVATPIGNLDDITYRAIKILQLVDFIICEDTRVSGKLLKKYAITKSLMVYNDHSDEAQRQKIISLLKSGKRAALISDAGTPLISDPGYKLLRSLREAGFKITPIPGPSSIIAALSVGNLPTDQFLFAGYLPPKTIARKKALLKFLQFDGTLIFLETSKRILDFLIDIYGILGNRNVTIARELTKLYEEVITLPVEELIDKYRNTPPKGEIVVLVEGAKEAEVNHEQLLIEINRLAKKLSAKDISNLLSEKYNLSKKIIYNLAKKL